MPRRVANGAAIRSIRELAGLSQRALAEKIGISTGALSQVESGGGMKPENLKRTAGVLGVPITAITEIEQEPEGVAS
jgi:transcriptional regulator with XRE-family HTH domain